MTESLEKKTRQWIVKRDLTENELSRELNALERNGTEVFQVLAVPRGTGCRFVIVGHRTPKDAEQAG